MSGDLNVIALISGGKDSFFSILHCIQNGHNVVALANLYPPSTRAPLPSHDTNEPVDTTIRCHSLTLNAPPTQHEKEQPDLHSFMYQTVGHTVIPMYSTALQLPLYRHQITGTSIQQSQYYDTSSFPHSNNSQKSGSASTSRSDETEDLVPLLRQVISAHPQANAVCTGAILSTYQRTRVESIALQLGLTPLSYLWQYPLLPPPLIDSTSTSRQTRSYRTDSLTGLLQDIGTSGLDARIIKVASAGISENLLFQNVADPKTQSRLLNGLSPFFEEDDEISLRGAVLGEGGEYETITLNGPQQVWKGGHIEIDSHNNEFYTEDGVHYLKFGQARIVPHDGLVANENRSNVEPKELVSTPCLLDPQFLRIKSDLASSEFDSQFKNLTINDTFPQPEVKQNHPGIATHTPLSLTVTGHTIVISNISSQSVGTVGLSNGQPVPTTKSTTNDTQAAAALQFENILNHLPNLFKYIVETFSISDFSTTNICSTTLLLSSIADFASINPIYARIWPKGLPNPPARVTIAAPLPSDIHISLSLTIDLCPQERRRGLHVQGWSYWAPANIGPYSQAIAVPLSINTPKDKHSPNDNEGSGILDANKLEIVHIAGQIPLVPSSMQVHAGSFLDTAILSAQHLWRVGQERGVDIWPWSVAYLAKRNENNGISKANTASVVWRQAHLNPTWTVPQDESDDDEDEDEDKSGDDEDEDATFDVWNIQHDRSQQQGFRRSQTSVGKHRHILPNHNLFKSSILPQRKYIPPFMAVEVNDLPRNVDIEWWSNGIAGLAKYSSSCVQTGWQQKTMSYGYISCLTIVPDTVSDTSVKFITYQISALSGESTLVPTTLSTILQLLEEEGSNSLPQNTQLVQGTAFVATSVFGSTTWASFMPSSSDSGSLSTLYKTVQSSSSQPIGLQVSLVPCHRLWGCPVSSFHKTKKRQDETSTAGNEVQELVAAFVLRVNVG